MRGIGRIKTIAILFLCMMFSVSSQAESPVKVALSYEMLKGLPEDINCLKRVEAALSPLEVEDVPWKRIMFSLEKGISDLTPCVFKTPEREEFLDFYGPIAALPIVMVSQKDRGLSFAQISELSGVFLRGTSLIKQYTTEGMKVFETSNIQNILDILKRKRADYSLMPKNFIDERDTEGLSVNVIDYIPLYIGVSKKSALNAQILHILAQNVEVLKQLQTH